MATSMTFAEAGFGTAPMRSTDGIVMAVAEGRGEVTVGNQTFHFGPCDVIAIPAWSWRSLRAEEDCLLFCFSGRVAQEKLGFYREQRGRPD